MKSTLTCGLFGFIIFLPMVAFAHTPKYQKALQHYQLGQQYYQEGKTEAAIEQFQQALKVDNTFAAAHNQLAVIYMNQGTLYGRIQAEGELNAALHLEPKNIEYNLNLGLLLLKKGLTGTAERQFQKIIKLDPQNSQAYLQLGRIKEDQWLRYRDMISPQSEGVVFRFDRFAKEDYWKALYYYSKAIASNPRLTEAYYRLSLMYFEQDSLAEMARLLEKAVIINPEDKNCHLFLGLCYHKLGYSDKALAQYLRARALMPEDERATFDSIEMIMSPDEAEQYQKAEASEKEHLQELFWKRRDPLFLTESNERLLEHYSRVAYANLRYGKPDKALEGWKTDRGKVYIRYGQPLELVRTRPSLEAPSKEVWLYPEFNFVFEDRFLSENYTFQWGNYFEIDYLDQYKRMIKRIPELYEPDFGGKPFSLPYIIATFRGKDSTVVDVFYGIPAEGVELSYHGDSTRLWVDQGLFLFNKKSEHFDPININIF
ncbi:MAG: GWxTD domain-containing protein [candidate division KSB1 bacterium]|nr:GWxTD domain-containing protein [candidate division KSB1 bacterium]